MPKLTLVLGRKTISSHDLTDSAIRIGREEGVDIVIDNPSVSRKHAEIRPEGGHWVVEDLGSSNGTFLNGNRIAGSEVLRAGDEIGIGKFSLLFDKEAQAAAAPRAEAPKARATMADFDGTMHIKPHEVEQLLTESSKQRKAHVIWESGGQRGTHHFTDQPAVLFGTDELCDVRVPKAPKHHVLMIRDELGAEVRNLTMFGKMKVGGSVKKLARLKDGDTAVIGGLKLTFKDEMG